MKCLKSCHIEKEKILKDLLGKNVNWEKQPFRKN